MVFVCCCCKGDLRKKPTYQVDKTSNKSLKTKLTNRAKLGQNNKLFCVWSTPFFFILSDFNHNHLLLSIISANLKWESVFFLLFFSFIAVGFRQSVLMYEEHVVMLTILMCCHRVYWPRQGGESREPTQSQTWRKGNYPCVSVWENALCTDRGNSPQKTQ